MSTCPPRRDFVKGTSRKCLAAGCIALASLAMPATAEALESYGAELVPLPSSELRALRGGIQVAGVDFDFGATVRVYVDGALVADTALTMNLDGSISHLTTIHDSTIASEFTGSLASGNIQITGPEGSIGVVIANDSGTSLALNNITASEAFGLLANDAIGRNIVQTIDLNLTVNNFGQINSMLQSDISAARAVSASMPSALLMH